MIKKAISHYLIISFSFMGVACGTSLFLNYMGFQNQENMIFFLLLAIGGLSTAIAGIVTSKKFHRIDSCKRILKDFFGIKQPLKHYGIVLVFLSLSFGVSLVSGQFKDNIAWYSFFQFFLIAILFGGIEEIGWPILFSPFWKSEFLFGLLPC